jgi:hypothetical protein
MNGGCSWRWRTVDSRVGGARIVVDEERLQTGMGSELAAAPVAHALVEDCKHPLKVKVE